MDTDKDRVVIESRLQLFSALAEAAETEHNLMCLYLYAMFALKRSEEERVNAKELEAIERWRRVILGISLEEMSHLSLVCNLFAAMGGSPHLSRPNFPASPGAYPAGMIIELAPFNLKTLDHFIYLEHPALHDIADSDAFVPEVHYERIAPKGRLTSSSGEYQTVGMLYDAIKKALVRLSGEIGEEELFCGNAKQQITPIDSPLRGLSAVHDLSSALTAIETIILQGEGATSSTNDSHFERFMGIKKEYLELLSLNPDFEPGRRVARNPVMRTPANPEKKVWVNHPISARYLDLANAFYGFMLRILTQVYFVEERDPSEKHELLEISFLLMHFMAIVGEKLTLLPVSNDNFECMAGMSFAMERTLTPLSKHSELSIILERLGIYDAKIRELQEAVRDESDPSLAAQLKSSIADLEITLQGVNKIKERIVKLQSTRDQREGVVSSKASKPRQVPDSVSPAPAPSPTTPIGTAENEEILISFDAKRCIHSRHCVTELPEVFKANTPGEWLFPSKARAEILAAVIRECPSGALSYRSKGALAPDDAPPVNVMRVSENGPYRFLSDLKVDGEAVGNRATLCRCGVSKNKPFCDHSHFEGGFLATGEPDLIRSDALENRGGTLAINRTKDGPLAIEGNVEICASTGHIVLRTTKVNLCRCGHSKTKPICDGTHQTIGFRDDPTQK
ncbi:MAG: hypothetical protein EOP06_06155 [Proteobacteria bacterium]|nr:MAG: hypothetical protein EOP06_06155 [Pseudomonadota bacterium]